MPFTFVYRSPYENLTGRFVRRFPQHSILSWFQEHWGTNADSGSLLGHSVYGFESLFEAIKEKQIPAPKDFEELSSILSANIYAELGTRVEPHLVEVFTDDDEVDLQYFFIEDEFAAQRPDRTKFLLHEGWLPTEVVANANSESEPCTYLYAHSPVQSADSQQWDRVVCKGVRVADDPKSVIGAYEEFNKRNGWVEAEEFLKALVKMKSKGQGWPEILKAWIQWGNESPAPGNASEIKCADHICQLNHHAKTWSLPRGDKRLFYQTILFDDVWEMAYPDLAKSIEHYASARSL